MLYEEKIMKELCQEMGITWTKERGFPDVNGTAFSSISMRELIDLPESNGSVFETDSLAHDPELINYPESNYTCYAA